METDIREKLERLKIKAEEFLKDDTRAFIVDINDTYYFCDIILVGDNTLLVQNFKGKRANEQEKIYWADIVKLEEYKDKEVENE